MTFTLFCLFRDLCRSQKARNIFAGGDKKLHGHENGRRMGGEIVVVTFQEAFFSMFDDELNGEVCSMKRF